MCEWLTKRTLRCRYIFADGDDDDDEDADDNGRQRRRQLRRIYSYLGLVAYRWTSVMYVSTTYYPDDPLLGRRVGVCWMIFEGVGVLASLVQRVRVYLCTCIL